MNHSETKINNQPIRPSFHCCRLAFVPLSQTAGQIVIQLLDTNSTHLRGNLRVYLLTNSFTHLFDHNRFYLSSWALIWWLLDTHTCFFYCSASFVVVLFGFAAIWLIDWQMHAESCKWTALLVFIKSSESESKSIINKETWNKFTEVWGEPIGNVILITTHCQHTSERTDLSIIWNFLSE